MSEYLRPTSLDEALRLRGEHPNYMVLAGGTDLLVAGHRTTKPPGVLDLFGLAELVGISEHPDGSVRIGAATTFAHIGRDDVAQRVLPCLVAASREVGALQIQARGTLGGNIGTSSPVGDSLPALLALDAQIELGSADGRRLVPYAEFCVGYRKTALAANELIVAVHVPVLPDNTVQYWRKVGTRRAQSISKVMMAAVVGLDQREICHARVAFGAVAATPIRAVACEQAMIGMEPSAGLATKLRTILASEITPIDDVRSNAAYRLGVAQNLISRFVTSLT